MNGIVKLDDAALPPPTSPPRPPPPPAACPSNYTPKYLARGSCLSKKQDADTIYTHIETKGACLYALERLGLKNKKLVVQTSKKHPRGCWRHRSNNNVYWNMHPVGKESWNVNHLNVCCASTGVETLPPAIAPTEAPTAIPTASPTATPTATPTKSPQVNDEPTGSGDDDDNIDAPTDTTPTPTATPTVTPTSSPTGAPSAAISVPTPTPTPAPPPCTCKSKWSYHTQDGTSVVDGFATYSGCASTSGDNTEHWCYTEAECGGSQKSNVFAGWQWAECTPDVTGNAAKDACSTTRAKSCKKTAGCWWLNGKCGVRPLPGSCAAQRTNGKCKRHDQCQWYLGVCQDALVCEKGSNMCCGKGEKECSHDAYCEWQRYQTCMPTPFTGGNFDDDANGY